MSKRSIKHVILITACVVSLAGCGAPGRQADQAPTANSVPPNANQEVVQPTPTAQLIPTTQPTPTISQNVPQGYLAVGTDYVQFLQWHENEGGYFTGRVQAVRIDSQNTLAVKPESDEIQGTRNGENVDLTLWGRSYIGTLAGDTLTLVVPTSTGELQTIEYRRATIDEYNEAARSFRQTIDQQAAEAQAAYQAQAAAAAAREAREQAMRAWQSAYEDANAALTDSAVIPEEAWFTDRDEGKTAAVVRDVQASMNTITTMVNDGDCFNFSFEVGTLKYHASELDLVRRDFDYTIDNLNNATATMQEKRDVLGADATEHMVGETTRIAEVAQQQIELVNKKYDQANQIVQRAVEEADALSCTSAQQ